MLACARLGAIHSVVFGGFAAHELAVRIDDAKPNASSPPPAGSSRAASCTTSRCSTRAIEMASAQARLLRHLPARAGGGEADRGPRPRLARASSTASTPAECVPVAGNHPAYILYTSGTTGQPKGVVRPTGGHLVALNWTMTNIYGVEPGEVFWAASDVGWVVGHSYICYAPADPRQHHHRVRGQARRHARCRHLLAGDPRPQGASLLHRAHRVPRHQARGSRRASC